MITLLYDGSFDGLLCCLNAAIKLNQDDIRIRPACHVQLSFGESTKAIHTSETLAAKTYSRIAERFGQESLENIYTAFLYPDSEDLILYYLHQMIRSSCTRVLEHPRLIPLRKRIRSVLREVHAFQGFIRFQEIETDIFYAAYEPTYDITGLLMPHFTERFPCQKMILHDIKRSYAAFYDKNHLLYLSMPQDHIPSFSTAENQHAALWKSYLQHLSINERTNPKLQRSLLPLKYRKYMTEHQ